MKRKQVVTVVYFPSSLLKSSCICIILLNPFSLPFSRISRIQFSIEFFIKPPPSMFPKRLFDLIFFFDNLVLSFFLYFLFTALFSLPKQKGSENLKSLFHKLWIFPNAFLHSFTFKFQASVEMYSATKDIERVSIKEKRRRRRKGGSRTKERHLTWSFLEFLHFIRTSISSFNIKSHFLSIDTFFPFFDLLLPFFERRMSSVFEKETSRCLPRFKRWNIDCYSNLSSSNVPSNNHLRVVSRPFQFYLEMSQLALCCNLFNLLGDFLPRMIFPWKYFYNYNRFWLAWSVLNPNSTQNRFFRFTRLKVSMNISDIIQVEKLLSLPSIWILFSLTRKRINKNKS